MNNEELQRLVYECLLALIIFQISEKECLNSPPVSVHDNLPLRLPKLLPCSKLARGRN